MHRWFPKCRGNTHDNNNDSDDEESAPTKIISRLYIYMRGKWIFFGNTEQCTGSNPTFIHLSCMCRLSSFGTYYGSRNGTRGNSLLPGCTKKIWWRHKVQEDLRTAPPDSGCWFVASSTSLPFDTTTKGTVFCCRLFRPYCIYSDSHSTTLSQQLQQQ